MTIGQNWEWNSMKNSNMAYATPHANGLSLPIRFETQEYPSKKINAETASNNLKINLQQLKR